MRTPGHLALVAALTGSALSAALSGCALLDGSSRLEEALEYLPADATTVTFVDRAAVADRVGDGTPEDAYGTELGRWTETMRDAAFDDSDVEWEATGDRDGRTSRVWRMRDDLDFDAVAADLEDAGFERTGPEHRPVFRADLDDADPDALVGGRYPALLTTVGLVPDEELIVSGSDVDALLDVVTDHTDSLADAGGFGDLLDQAEDQDALEYAALTLAPACGDSGAALLVPTDGEVRAVRLFDDESDRTEADFAARSDLVAAFARREGPFACPVTPDA